MDTLTPIAIIDGQPFDKVPTDLFIPPDALLVLLDSFSGPLDLLLYLIRQQNIDILDIPIFLITQQYMHYIEVMEEHRISLASDYLVMAALLAEIKSRMLLPVQSLSSDDGEEDPRMELVRRLQHYEQFKQAALDLDALPRQERDVFSVHVGGDYPSVPSVEPLITVDVLVKAFEQALQQKEWVNHHPIKRELLTVRERMTRILERLNDNESLELSALIDNDEGRLGVVVIVLAILELAKQMMIVITQASVFGPIYVQRGSLK